MRRILFAGLLLALALSASSQEVGNVICPGGQSQCPDGNTCCKLSSGQYGCCPLPKAVCCSDHTHCCPNDHTCDVAHGTCKQGDLTVPWTEKNEATPIPVGNVICDGGQAQCPDGNTCCKLSSGQYGCCPLPKAVCCSDHTHCCPKDHTCDVAHGTCKQGDLTVPWVEKNEATPIPAGNVICPGGQAQCPDGNTCCKLSSGQYGCCPLPKAVCCTDHVHCCPTGYTCNVAQGTCFRGDIVLPWHDKTEATPVGNVICDGGQAQCPDGNTCCKLSSGQYGCCPLPKAVCCSDHTHCCPKDHTCDVAHGTCKQGDLTVPWVEKNEATPIPVGNVICDGGQAQCPDGNTCCKLSSGQYGCCPLPKAVCCSDHTHCCPKDHTCDVAHGTCKQGDLTVPWVEKNEATPIPVGNVICDGGQAQCPDGNTCCKLSSGQYGCCPLPKAVCCSDHTHCCPKDHTCDVAHGTCKQGDLTVPWVEKNEATPIPVGNVICDGGQAQCPDGNTCCKLSTGQYGCCPLPKAVCCSDHTHCCPEGYTCNIAQGTCARGDLTVPWAEKNVAKPIKVGSVICPGGQAQCPDGSTCCQLASGQFACCPLPLAVCCSDHIHCCPNGYTCNVAQGTCARGDLTVPWMEKNVAKPIKVGNVVCPGGQAQCPDRNTCCKLSSGQYGCCPIPKAVCCSDHTHCCPNGYTCDVAHGTCTQGDLSVPWMEKNVAKPIQVLQKNATSCPGDHYLCKAGSTCCLSKNPGVYECCAYPKAVCCGDGVHCCPSGTTCDINNMRCLKKLGSFPWEERVEAEELTPEVAVAGPPTVPVMPDPNVVCPGGLVQCPAGQTCSLLASGQWGCCPYPQAVCCSDHVHCCPSGYTCNAAQGTCFRGGMELPWHDQAAGEPLAAVAQPNILCPGGQYECPSDTTCCLQNTGAYGCCPYPQAVCCADRIHCCPYGYTCHLPTATCYLGDLSLPWASPMAAGSPMVAGSPSAPEMPEPNVLCPGGQVQCPAGQTCCMLFSGQWGCCPYTQAVCCSDHVHCCPSGYVCLVQGTCFGGGMELPWHDQVAGEPLAAVAQPNILCPGGQYECPSDTTCCLQNTGAYGCCPYPQAVCCTDHVHCCPTGYTCNVAQGTCFLGDIVLPWHDKTEATPTKVEGVVCPGSTAVCPSDNTCCKMAKGDWGCCPLPEAVCCSDKIHCCPKGLTCDKARCTGPSGSTPWLTKTLAAKMAVKERIPWVTKTVAHASDGVNSMGVGSVQCDSTHYCPDKNTCCRLASGQWGCCPIRQAVCCADHIHCCPKGYTCQVGSCFKEVEPVAWTSKTYALSAFVGQVPCDTKHSCSDGNTCCKLATGEWGCCPLPKAVCCDDKQHCCPQGTTCNVAAGTCKQKSLALGWTTETLALTVGPKSVQCDVFTACPTGNTCCLNTAGGWDCCPLPSAVCCSDLTHCCPYGYTCDVSSGTCGK